MRNTSRQRAGIAFVLSVGLALAIGCPGIATRVGVAGAPDAATGSALDASVSEAGTGDATEAGLPDAEAGAGAGAGADADVDAQVDGGSDAGVDADIPYPDCGVPEPVMQPGPDPGMVFVSAGPFWQGCNAAIDTQCDPNEFPGRCVTLSDYEIDVTEVTQAQYADFVADAGYKAPVCNEANGLQWYFPETEPDWPVMCVDHVAATAYCNWLGKQLPTEAQSEKAARGTDARIYPWGNEPPNCALANFVGCDAGVADVGIRPLGASPYGALDMTSNVMSWTRDYYDATYYSYAPDVDPLNSTCDLGPDCLYVCRAMPWDVDHLDADYLIRASGRGGSPAAYETAEIGFRCEKDLQ